MHFFNIFIVIIFHFYSTRKNLIKSHIYHVFVFQYLKNFKLHKKGSVK